MTWTYAEFDRLVERVARTLAAAGVEESRSVHLVLGNSPTFVAVWLAAIQLGAHVVPSDPASSPRELADVIGRTAPVLTVCTRDAAAAVETADPHHVVLLDQADTGMDELIQGQGQGQATDGLPPYKPLPSDLASVLFTSGTTSKPKGVMVTQGNYAFVGEQMASLSGLRPQDTQVVALPLFHANAQYYSICPAIAVGARVLLLHRFTATRYIELCREHGATHGSLFAAPIRMILARADDRQAPAGLSNLWFAQNLTSSEYEAIQELAGCRPRQLYGMTETIAPVLSSDWLSRSNDSIGRPSLGCSVQLVDANGRPVGPHERGDIEVSGTPGATLFLGYLDDSEATSSAYRDGWFRTGDFAWRDAEGVFHFDGRQSERLKVSGENVSTVEVELVLSEHPGVAEVAVVGGHDEVRDEVPVAYIVQSGRETRNLETSLREHCAERLSKPKRPVEYRFVEELPKTSVGKIKKHQLHEA